jgi:hypothetical protein
LILTAGQPCYLPWLGLFDKIAQADLFCIFDVVPIDSSSITSFENRNKIFTPTGELWLTVPIRRQRHAPLSEIRVADDTAWQRKHWRSIELSYSKAPFWSTYAPDLEPFYMGVRWEMLVELDHVMLRWCLNALGLARPITRASSLGNLNGTKSGLVLSMCKELGATEYIFGSQGRNYANVAAFEAAGIKVRFQDYKHPTYQQMHPGFVSHLSIIDLLMNCGPDALRILRNAP